MTTRQVIGEAARSLVATLRGVVRYGGRSRVTDVVWYWLACSLVYLAAPGLANLLPWDASWALREGVRLLTLLPLIPLFVRRLHDQGVSGWWTWFLLPLPAVNLYQSYRATFAVLNPEWLTQPSPLDGVEIWLLPIALAILLLLVRPGMSGPNRYGPDPRQAAISAT